MSQTVDPESFSSLSTAAPSKWEEVGIVGYAQGGLDGRIIHGINCFRKKHPHMVLRDAEHKEFLLQSLLHNPRLKGLIANVTDHKRLNLLQKSGLPIVDTSGILPECPFPQIGIVPCAIGKVGGEFFHQRGVKRIVYVSGMQCPFEIDHWQGLREYCHHHDLSAWWWSWSEGRCIDQVGEDAPLKILDPKPGSSPHPMIASLPKPVGMFAATDRLGVKLCDECRIHGLHVPEDVQIIGVDNNEYFCESATPQLTSIILPGEEIGYQAAALLHKMINGEPHDTFVRIEPDGLEIRESTSD